MAAVPAVRARQGLDFQEDRIFHALYHELRYPVASLKPDRVLGVRIQQDHHDLATVPGVHGAGRVDNGDSVPSRQPGSRMHECCVPIWQRYRHPGADNCALAWTKLHISDNEQVAARIPWVRAFWHRQAGIQPLDQDFHRCWPVAAHGIRLPLVRRAP
jgi:hypothetical protein